ncbi:MAG: DUF4426 domain-containing protein [Gammaproteobacteria bacterium]|nr:DUF4426 domain-containing protein [Gammaproteobacteria bacterium]
MGRKLRAFSLLATVLLAAPVPAEQSVTVGEHTIHYNALPTDMLNPAVAKSYGIKRSHSRALLNVSVLKKTSGLTGQPVRAKVRASATNLNAQLRSIDMREITEQGAIYYIGEVPVSDGETLKFKLEVTPEGMNEPAEISFDQEFFTE